MAMISRYLAGEWEWNESMTNEQARFLLPLAWLVRAGAYMYSRFAFPIFR
jgi:hypothetical protein